MLRIRKANLKDSKVILEWRNNLESRMNSKDKKIINKKTHNIWFNTKLNSTNVHIFMLELKSEKVGVVKYKSNADYSKFSVSININPAYRNKGLGKKLLLLGDEKIKSIVKKDAILIAEVGQGNLKSNKIFKDAGYAKVKRDKAYNIYNKSIRGIMNRNKKKDPDYYLKIIDNIQKIRSKNNVNWMDILRLAFKSSPDEAKKIMKKINSDDDRISELFNKLSD